MLRRARISENRLGQSLPEAKDLQVLVQALVMSSVASRLLPLPPKRVGETPRPRIWRRTWRCSNKICLLPQQDERPAARR